MKIYLTNRALGVLMRLADWFLHRWGSLALVLLICSLFGAGVYLIMSMFF